MERKKYPLELIPVSKNAVWGGDTLLKKYGKKNGEATLAESWELTLNGADMSVINNGEYASMTLGDYLGLEQGKNGTYGFSLLIKFIDAKEKLSVQVHPDKTELWYIVEAQKGAQLVYGLKEDFDEEKFRAALQNGTLDNLLRFIDVKPGEFYLLPSGLVHAIGGGILIAEIQQNSSTTYRVYDYNRGRQIQTETAIETIKRLGENGDYRGRTECGFFKVDKKNINGLFVLKEAETFFHVLCIGGSGFIGGYKIERGSSYFIPARSGDIDIISETGLSLLITAPK